MARIPEETIEEIRQQANIIDLISEYVTLKKSGKNHLAHCPFHEDNTPSFSVSEEKQLFHCFSCGRGGTIFTFLQEMEGDSFLEAVVKVAEMVDYPLDQQLTEQVIRDHSQVNTFEKQLLQMYEDTTEFYHHLLLHTEQGKEAYRYLIERGLTKETIKNFKIGYSPAQRNALQLYLNKKNKDNHSLEQLYLQSGLFSDYHLEHRGEFLDRFSERIIFPIFDSKGQSIAFSGRIFKKISMETQHVAKYMNSPETVLFTKSKILFNLHQARSEIRRQGEVILFEGFMDVIAAWQAGIRNGVATMGTALTDAHLQSLDRYTDHLLLAFDGDQAGMNATHRTLHDITLHSHFTVETVNFPPGDDPDEFIKKYGAERFTDLINHGRETVLNFYMEYYRLGKNLANETEQIEYINKILVEVAKIASPIEKDLILNKLVEEFSLSLESIQHQFQTLKKKVQSEQLQELRSQRSKQELEVNSNSVQILYPTSKITVVERAEQMLLHRLFNSDHAWEVVNQINPTFTFAHENYQLLYILYQAYREKEQSYSISAFLDSLTDNDLKNLTTTIMWLNLGMSFTEEEIKDYMRIIENVSPLKEKLKQKREELLEAKRLGNQAAITSLSVEVVQLNQKLKNNKL